MPYDWQAAVDALTDVQKLVHLAARCDLVDVETWRTEILKLRRQAYNDELSIQARHVGCPGARGQLGNGDILSRLNELSRQDAESICGTYNYFLAHAIAAIGAATPTANRHVYAYRLRPWMDSYWQGKRPQVQEYSDRSARREAQQDFYEYNAGRLGTAKLTPETAVCPICAGWLARGLVPLRVALNDPPPYHVTCPHIWDTRPDKVTPDECKTLWLGS